MFSGPEPPQKVELLQAEQRDVGHRFRTGQHRSRPDNRLCRAAEDLVNH